MNSSRALKPRSLRAVVMACVAVVASLALAGPASAGPRDLIDATPAEVALDAPAPGESRTWTMSVTSTTDQTVALDLEITGQSDRLFGGAHPLQITISDTTGRTVLEPTDVADVIGASLHLANLPAGESRQLVGTVTLPPTAGNEYQGAGAELRLRFLAQADEPAKAPGIVPSLPVTGPALVAAAGLLAALSITIGLALKLRTKKAESHV